MDWGKLIVDSVFASIVGTAIASLTTIIVNAISHSSHLKEIKDAGNKAVQNTNELKEENIKEHTLLHADHEKTDLLITSQTREIIANLSKAEKAWTPCHLVFLRKSRNGIIDIPILHIPKKKWQTVLKNSPLLENK